ncbi:MAG: CHAT domain-containing protein, partial [Polyangiaceae bacterium]
MRWNVGWAWLVAAVLALSASPVGAQGKKPSPAQAAKVAEAQRINEEAEALFRKGDFAAALVPAKQTIALLEKALGPDDLEVANAVNNLAGIQRARGELAEAEALTRRVLAIREKALGPDAPKVAASLEDLGDILLEKAARTDGASRAEYDLAEPPLLRALSIHEKRLGADPTEDATRALTGALLNLSILYLSTEDYDRTELLLQRALPIYEKAFGADSLEAATFLNNLAMLFRSRARYERAAQLLTRAIEIGEKRQGANSPQLLAALHNLALIYMAEAEYGLAEARFLRALELAKSVYGPESIGVATIMDSLANLYGATGEMGRAEPLSRGSLAILEKLLPPDDVELASALSNVAHLDEARGDDEEAERKYNRAIALEEKAQHGNHPTVTYPLLGLAHLYMRKGDFARAEPLVRRALTVREAGKGPNHPIVADALVALAEIHVAAGNTQLAEAAVLRAIAIQEGAMGPDHPDVAQLLFKAAALRAATGKRAEALELHRRAGEIVEKHISNIIAGGSEAQKRAFLAKFDVSSAVNVAFHERDPGTSQLALTGVLRFKGRALDAMSGSLRAVRARLGPDEQRLFDKLDAARSEYIALSLRGPGPLSAPVYRERLARLDEQIREGEAAISEQSSAYRQTRQPITTEGVQAVLRPGAALVEWLIYRPQQETNRFAPSRGAPRYSACVLLSRGAPVWIDLGDVASIDASISELRSALRRPASEDVPRLARALEARVMAPVRAALGGANQVFLSPDGALNLVPFGALVDDTGHSLVESFAFTYVTSGRDLLRSTSTSPVRDAPLVLAAPDFDAGARSPGGRFSPLLHGEEEAAAIAALFQGVHPVLAGDATKARLKKAHGPRLLHIGAHGYYQVLTCGSGAAHSAGDNPLLKSGIALAGANACADGKDDGLLTALEASGLDLYGTKLAVLSACETGVGDPVAGDGVYGLRRALTLAGAETLVVSLWPVDGSATASLMKAYYESLARGGGRSEAMRQVQLAMLSSARSHPYYWAGFLVSGDDRSLDGRNVTPNFSVRPGPRGCTCDIHPGSAAEGPAWMLVVLLGLLSSLRRRRRSLARRSAIPACAHRFFGSSKSEYSFTRPSTRSLSAP